MFHLRGRLIWRLAVTAAGLKILLFAVRKPFFKANMGFLAYPTKQWVSCLKETV